MALRGPSLGIRIEQALHDALKRLADEDDRTLSAYLERLLYKHVADSGIVLKKPVIKGNRRPVRMG